MDGQIPQPQETEADVQDAVDPAVSEFIADLRARSDALEVGDQERRIPVSGARQLNVANILVALGIAIWVALFVRYILISITPTETELDFQPDLHESKQD